MKKDPLVRQIFCLNKCCVLTQTTKIVHEQLSYILDTKKRKKSGVCIIDSENKILISQSYNSYWGIPKGSKEINETDEETSIRETKEETGINLDKELFLNNKKKHFLIKNTLYSLFFIRIKNKGDNPIEYPHLLKTESTGCGWINIDCLIKLEQKKLIKLNYITKLVLFDLKNKLNS